MGKPKEEVALVFDEANKKIKVRCESEELPVAIVEALLNMLFNNIMHDKFKGIQKENEIQLQLTEAIGKLGWSFAILLAVLLIIKTMKG